MVHNVIELLNKHAGQDIYVLGSGKSMDFIPKDFWNTRIVIGVNQAWQHFRCDYIINHHHQFCQIAIDDGQTVITSEYATCVLTSKLEGFYGPYPHHDSLKGDYYIYKHLNQTYSEIDLRVFDHPEYLVAGGTIVTTALNLAHRMGARAIILAGCDAGAFDGAYNLGQYKWVTNDDHFIYIQDQMRKMANHIRSKGVPVMSVNPWIDFNFEGHVFTPMI